LKLSEHVQGCCQRERGEREREEGRGRVDGEEGASTQHAPISGTRECQAPPARRAAPPVVSARNINQPPVVSITSGTHAPEQPSSACNPHSSTQPSSVCNPLYSNSSGSWQGLKSHGHGCVCRATPTSGAACAAAPNFFGALPEIWNNHDPAKILSFHGIYRIVSDECSYIVER